MSTRSFLNLPSGAAGLDAQIQSGVQRIERVVAFAQEVGTTLTEEFAAFWRDPGAGEEGERLRAQLAAMKAQVDASRAFLKTLDVVPPYKKLESLKAHDLAPLARAAQGLEAAADRLRARQEQAALGPRPGFEPPPARPQPGAPPARPGGSGVVIPPRPAPGAARHTGALTPPREGTDTLRLGGGSSGRTTSGLGRAAPPTGMLRREAAPDVRRMATGRPAGLPPARPPLPSVEKNRQAFEAALALVAEVLEFISPRLLLVKVSLVATGLPGRKRPWETITQELLPAAQAAGVPQPQMLWLPLLVKLFYTDMTAVQRAHMALVQWDQALKMHTDAGRVQSEMTTEPAGKHRALLDSFHLGKYRAAIYPLSHLHVSFKGLPHLSELFPPPAPQA